MDVRLYFCAVPRVPTMASLSRAVALPEAAGSAEALLRVCHCTLCNSGWGAAACLLSLRCRLLWW